jgi:hypothetical protein
MSHPRPQAVLANADRIRPQAEEAARQLIRSWTDYGARNANLCDPDMLPGVLAEVGKSVLDATLREGAKDFSGVLAYLTGAPAGIRSEFVECCQGNAPLPQDCGPLLTIIRDWHREHRKDMIAARLRSALDNGDPTAGILREFADLEAEAGGHGIDTLLAARAFDPDNPPLPPVPVLSLNDKFIGTHGNILALQAGMKSGKTGAVGAINAAFFIGRIAGNHDTLGFTADNPAGHAVLHFDTEQSRFDHDATIRRALARVGMAAPPAWFRSYSVADLTQGNRLLALESAVTGAVADFGGIRAIILDGVADFMRDPNNPEEAFSLVDKLHADAIRHNCLILAVIHENPGSENGKTRGHLGSQLARKAETNLRMAKDPQTGITTVWADYARHCHIPKDRGTCFAWCDMLGRHVSKGTAGEIVASAKREKFREEAESAFGDAPALSYAELVAAIVESTGLSERTAERRVVTYQTEGITIKNHGGNYMLKS